MCNDVEYIYIYIHTYTQGKIDWQTRHTGEQSETNQQEKLQRTTKHGREKENNKRQESWCQ